MKSFYKLALLGVFLVTLLIVIDTIDAGKKDQKKGGIENSSGSVKGSGKNERNEKLKKTENQKKFKSPNTDEYYKEFSKNSKFGQNKNKVKGGASSQEGLKPKITKTYEKVKRYKVVEDEKPQKPSLGKPKVKESKIQSGKHENKDGMFKPELKSNSNKKVLKKEQYSEDLVAEEQNEYIEENVVEEESINKNPKKKYKLVQVVEEDAEEDSEGNGTITEVGLEDEELMRIERTESEEFIEKFKKTQTVKLPKFTKLKKEPTSLEEGTEEELNSEGDIPISLEETSEPEFDEDFKDSNFQSKYQDPNKDSFSTCKPIPTDSNRQGPKKLTFLFSEEKINGQIKNEIMVEEDGVTLCEVHDLLYNYYNSEVPNE